jgi:hypothetical protein
VTTRLSLLLRCNGNELTIKSNSNVLIWTEGLKKDGACSRTVNTIYTNASEGPTDQTSEQVYALRAEKLIDKAK